LPAVDARMLEDVTPELYRKSSGKVSDLCVNYVDEAKRESTHSDSEGGVSSIVGEPEGQGRASAALSEGRS
jgi:hypothetical protein